MAASLSLPQQYVVVPASSAVRDIIREQATVNDKQTNAVYPTGGSSNDAAVLKGEVVLVPNVRGHACDFKSHPRGRCLLNGMRVPTRHDTPKKKRSALSQEYRVLGVAREDVPVDTDNPSLTPSFTTVISGLSTITNTSQVPILAGDLIRARWPDLDARQRRRHSIAPFSAQRLVMETSPFRMVDSTDCREEVMQVMLMEPSLDFFAAFATFYKRCTQLSMVQDTAAELAKHEAAFVLWLNGGQRADATASLRLTTAALGGLANGALKLEADTVNMLAGDVPPKHFARFPAVQYENEDLYKAYRAAFLINEGQVKIMEALERSFLAPVNKVSLEAALPELRVETFDADAKKIKVTLKRLMELLIKLDGGDNLNRINGVFIVKFMQTAISIASVVGKDGLGVALTSAKPGEWFDIMLSPSCTANMCRP